MAVAVRRERDGPRSRRRGHAASAHEGSHVIEMQRRRLLSGMCEVVAERGLEHAGVGAICARARVSRRTFYDLFEDREACFMALLEETIEQVETEIRRDEALSGQDSGHGSHRAHAWQEDVRDALSALLVFFDAHPMLARACLLEAMKGGPKVMVLRQNTIARIVAAIEQNGTASRTATATVMREDPGVPSLVAQGIVGGAISVIQTRLLEKDNPPLIPLLNPLMSLIVLPYLGPAAARRQRQRPTPERVSAPTSELHQPSLREPFKDIPMRLTFRTARVIATIHAHPGASNRQIGDAAGIADQGQISKLLRRLAGYGLIQNTGNGHSKGEPNAWTLTAHGHAIQNAVQTPIG